MRITHIAETAKGGIGSYIQLLLVHQISQYGANQIDVIVPIEDVAIDEFGVNVIAYFKVPALGRLGSLAANIRVIASRLASAKPDVVHLHGTFAGLLRPLVRLLLPKSVICYCAHGWSFAMEEPWAIRQLYCWVEVMLLPFCSCAITISSSDNLNALRANLNPSKLKLIKNSVAPVCKSVPPAPVTEGKNYLFVGRLDRQIGYDILRSAVQLIQNPNFHLYVAGESVSERTSAPENSPAITHLGWLHPSALAAFYNAVDAVIMPSRWEGFGLVALEAMSAGKPVIGSDRGALPELVEHGKTGFIFPLNDPTVLAKLLQETTKSTFALLGLRAAEQYNSKWLPQRLYEEVDRMYGFYVKDGAQESC